MIAFESIVKPLLFLHLLGAITALASAVHMALRMRRARQGQPGHYRTVRLHATVLLGAYSTALALGMLIYPTFRVRVRHEFLDTQVPLATALFEIKEHAAALGLLPVLILFALTRPLAFNRPLENHYLPLFTTMLAFVLGTLTFSAVCGWWLGTVRSV